MAKLFTVVVFIITITFRNARITYQRVWPSFLFSASFCRVNKMIQWMSSDVTTSALYKLPRAIDNRPFFLLRQVC